MTHQSLFEPPIIGPFVEANGRREEKAQTGARVTWTAGGEAYSLDLDWKGHGTGGASLGFEQIPEMELDFEDFCLLIFRRSTRLRNFLNELTQFIRPSGGSPTNASAGEWLHPRLVQHDFTLGIPKFRKDSVRVPVVCVFGGNAGAEAHARHIQRSRSSTGRPYRAPPSVSANTPAGGLARSRSWNC